MSMQAFAGALLGFAYWAAHSSDEPDLPARMALTRLLMLVLGGAVLGEVAVSYFGGTWEWSGEIEPHM